MSTRKQGVHIDHAVVMGGSMAGMLAAAALAKHAERVTVIERDAETPGPRRGVPQGKHAHILLDRGRLAIEGLLPGIFGEMEMHGSRNVDFGQHVWWFHNGAWKVLCDTPYRLYVQTRPFLERHVRDFLLRRSNITMMSSTRILRPSIVDGRVRAVEIQHRDRQSPTELSCDVLIDATGRGSRSPRWLADAGYPSPEEQTVRVDLAYATRLHRRPPDADARWTAYALYGRRPDQRRHGILLTVEDDTWQFTMMGYGGDHPPADHEGFEDFARSLARPDLYKMMRSTEILSDVAQFKVPAQRWRRYDRLRRLPAGYGILGDAVCSFDPVFGQGISIAALEAEQLDRSLADGPFDARRLAKATSKIIATPWLLSSMEAHRYPAAQDTRPRGVGVLHRLIDRVFARTATDPVVYRAFLSVMQLHQGPEALLKPSVLARLFRGSREPASIDEPVCIVGP